MEGIPPPLPSDSEDVAWALQTAEALWKRNERVDAIVWLRRAAQAAGDSEDDERALTLARNAAELTEVVAQHTARSGAHDSDLPPFPTGRVSARPAARSSNRAAAWDQLPDFSGRPSDLPDLSRDSDDLDDEVSYAVDFTQDLDGSEEEPTHVKSRLPRISVIPAAGQPPSRPPSESKEPVQRAASASSGAQKAAQRRPPPPPPKKRSMLSSPELVDDTAPTRQQPRLPTDPLVEELDDADLLALAVPTSPPPPVDAALPSVEIAPSAPPPEVRSTLTDEQLDDLEPTATATAEIPKAAIASQAPPPKDEPIVLPPVAFAEVSAPVSAPKSSASPVVEAPVAVAPLAVTPAMDAGSAPASPTDAPSADVIASKLDLAVFDAFQDLPDDAREAFAKAATVHALKQDEEASGFALALVVDGKVDVSAAIVDAPAERIGRGAVLRSQGTIGAPMKLRLIAVDDVATVATWDDGSVDAAFRSCPWVTEEMATAADRTQALVGITLGAIADRLDAHLRQALTDRLHVKKLESGEVLAEGGKAVPGLNIVGVGSVELVEENAVRSTLEPGEILFGTEVLGGGKAPFTARAGAEGAVLLFAERSTLQDLLMTCPPLLEILAGM